jgi:hypothetical protein
MSGAIANYEGLTRKQIYEVAPGCLIFRDGALVTRRRSKWVRE